MHLPPVPYRGGVVVGMIVSLTPRNALFFVGGQFNLSRSEHADSDAQITNRIRLLRIMQGPCPQPLGKQ